ERPGAAGLGGRGPARRRLEGRPGEPGHNRGNPCTYRAPAWHVGGGGREKEKCPLAYSHPRERRANTWRARGSPQFLVRPAEPRACVPDVVPGLLPRPAVHRPRPGDAWRAARPVAAAGGGLRPCHGPPGASPSPPPPAPP